MLNTLKAVVEGDRIRWQEPVDDILDKDHAVEVLVTVLKNREAGISPAERGKRRVAALQKLAAMNAFSSIEDPVQWQREGREDRDLPGRDK